MSLSDLITNLTLTLKKHVDNNHIDDVTMLTILTDTLNNFCTKLNDSQLKLYQHTYPKTTSNIGDICNNFNPVILNDINIIIKSNINKKTTDIDLTPLSTATGGSSCIHSSSSKKWCDYDESDSGDDWCCSSKVNKLNVDGEKKVDDEIVCVKKVDNKIEEKKQKKDKKFEKNKRNDYYDKNSHKLNVISVDVLQKYQKNCERTITYFIHNYKIDHFDSAKNIQDLNLIIARLLGLNFNDNKPYAYSNVCWFMRNTKCYYTDCAANNHNMCTYAHPKNHKTTQYCCVDDDEFDSWPDNYYKCLKMDFNDDVNAFIKKNGNKRLPIDTYKSTPSCIIEWYEYMTELLLNNDT